MPLDRDHITSASRVMLPSYVVFFGGLGAGYIAGFRIGQNPMLRFANEIMPLQVWGGVFVCCSLLMVAAMVRGSRMLYRYALNVCAISMFVWTTVAVIGIFYQPVTFTAPLWPFLVMQACRASNRSLLRGETDRTGA